MKEIVAAIYFVLDGIPHDHIDPRYTSTRDMGEVSIGPKGLGAHKRCRHANSSHYSADHGRGYALDRDSSGNRTECALVRAKRPFRRPGLQLLHVGAMPGIPIR